MGTSLSYARGASPAYAMAASEDCYEEAYCEDDCDGYGDGYGMEDDYESSRRGMDHMLSRPKKASAKPSLLGAPAIMSTAPKAAPAMMGAPAMMMAAPMMSASKPPDLYQIEAIRCTVQ